jgi:hypothetical protein
MARKPPADLDARAREVWAMLSRDKNPMPAGVALDYLQEHWDDRRACARALYRVAGETIGEAHVGILGYQTWKDTTQTGRACRAVGRGHFAAACERVEFVSSHAGDGSEWDHWWGVFQRTVALCRAIEAAV